MLTACLSAQDLRQELDRLVGRNEAFAGGGHTGFYLYDLTDKRAVYAYRADSYFVPASNVKLLTFYLALHELGNSAPALHYQRDSTGRLHAWGTGYPLLLHPGFLGFDELGPWLNLHGNGLTLHLPPGQEPPRYGNGWSWDDYDYPYVYERSALPVYGNRLYLEPAEGPRAIPLLYGSPPTVAERLIYDEGQERTLSRGEGSNQFSVGRYYREANFPQQRPLTVTPTYVRQWLREVYGDSLRFGDRPRPPLAQLSSLPANLPDTVYRRLMQDSDNFVAEQLILQVAAQRYGNFDEETVFDYATDTLFTRLRLGNLRMADGSGLSRYNLATPRQMVSIVRALDRELGRERLLALLPAGGVNGTLERRFRDRPEQPYVWAKTGSLSGVTALSGMLRADSGRTYAFSFLHNNVVAPIGSYYYEMERILRWLRDNG